MQALFCQNPEAIRMSRHPDDTRNSNPPRMNRRNFLTTAATVGVGMTLAGMLQGLAGCALRPPRVLDNLVKDPRGLCDLPKGFTYTVISPFGERMSDGHTVPDYHDGMGCFEAPEGRCILVRNHEISTYFPTDPPSPAPAHAYDPASSGGTTTIWLNERLEVERHYLSLTGTIRNCSGGQTPWGTWISCEEAAREGWLMGKRHGYNFEVDPREPLRLAAPLTAMGRFNHEAVAIDAGSGIAYQTEDQHDGCFYRFIPSVKGNLAAGGKLQALKFTDSAIRHTTDHALEPGRAYACEWVGIDEPDPEEDTVRDEAQAKGAAIFVRCEGMVAHADGIYFVASAGGAEGEGQIFRYRPDAGGPGGTLELIFTAGADTLLSKPDNLTVAPWGDLVLCEDSRHDENCLAGLTPQGKVYLIAANAQSEWCGACFSPDGRTLFANIFKKPGMTLAIRGPWDSLRNGGA
jgi:secreted PhoX family phosphatase